MPHHVTQRGYNEEVVFPTDHDKSFYLDSLRFQCSKHKVRILGYCLMTNHIHMIIIPSKEDSLALVMRRTQGKYSQYLNASRNRRGHVWQDRFFSCALGDSHLIHALRYVDRNPVRAGMVKDALDYPWSSARAHADFVDSSGVVDLEVWQRLAGGLDWRRFTGDGEEEDTLQVIREHTRSGSPLGLMVRGT